ncbi:hypothetical protein [Bacillus xiapuensis]|uniref:Uncharacterized protein n=1 Tax=Bacillus xiapuensis TaxID=2014075 RepID=A0ABU6NAI7_9BACI|nr:hypothetical protein [Bacillus xiapuensis]
MKNYSVEQLNYLEAKTQYEMINEQIEIEKEKQGVNKLVTDGRRTPENREIAHKRLNMISEIENKLGKWKVLDQLIDAEDELIKWSHEHMKKAKEYNSQKEEMERLFKDYKKFPKIREKMIDAASKLILNKPAI